MNGIIDLAYLITCATAGVAGLRSRARGNQTSWYLISMGLLLLAVMRIAQAGVWIDFYLAEWLRSSGSYGSRRPLQLAAIGAFAAAGLAAFRVHPAPAQSRHLLAATTSFYGLVIFGVVRASSFHWTDQLLGEQIGVMPVGHAVQIGLLLMVILACVVELYFPKTPFQARI